MGQPILLTGVVKAVLSGDTLLIMGADASKGPPPEKQISLSNIAAPRLGNRNGTPDQPFAWASREFLRKEAIGKRVTFRVDLATPSGREMGAAYLEETSIAALLVSHGWAKVKQPPGNEPPSAELEELVNLARQAEEQQLGLWSPQVDASAAVRTVNWANTFDSASLLHELKGQPQDAIIEQVATGSMLRVMLLPGYHQVTLLLSGIHCPSIRRAEDGSEDAAPFAREARYFVETRLLHRDVQVKLEGVDRGGALFGSVLHPQGNMSVELVKVGLARVVDWSLGYCDFAPLLRTTERDAKSRRLRLWRDYVPPNSGNDMSTFTARVAEIVSGDTLVVADQDGAERRVSLSSVRCPRVPGKDVSNADPAQARENVRNAVYGAEAKEFLRKALIGKKVKVVPEYKRNFAAEGAPAMERMFATVLYAGEKNVAELLIGEGLGIVARTGQSDERSLHYEALIEAEAAATAAKKGLHSPSEPSRAQHMDLSLPASRDRAKSYLSSLQRHGRVRAVVQFMMNGARFKLLVPKENCVIIFSLAGIRCPQTARNGSEAEPYADDAYAFARSQCFQREVDIETDTVDKNGAFFGSLFLPDKRNLGVTLLEAGLAQRIPPAADRSAHGHELAAAEDSAKKANLKVWENYSELQEAEARAAAAAQAAAEEEPTPDSQKQVLELEVVEICDGCRFFCHVAGNKDIVALQQQLAASSLKDDALGHKFQPGVGGICMAKFSEDDQWYRAKVLKRQQGKVDVFFIDYGNKDVVADDRLRPLDPTLNTQVVAAQAVECRLAHLVVSDPTDGADGQDAAVAFSAAAWGKPLLARIEDRKAGVLHVTLFVDAQTNINEQLVSAGLARVEKTAAKRLLPLLQALQEKELTAKKERNGVWKYGDIDDDED